VTLQDLDSAAPALSDLRTHLADYQDGLVPIDDGDLAQLLGNARALLEALYRQHLTFSSEEWRPVTGSPLSLLQTLLLPSPLTDERTAVSREVS
jgi:hypothetical protein